jgi:Na+-transporting NADH:ubiquinone oxidoreductase subunit A
MINLTRGFDIKLQGRARHTRLDILPPETCALKPPDVPGIEPIPTLLVREGERILAGDPVFTPKSAPDVKFCSPVSGRIVEIRRGAKRAIAEIVIEVEKAIETRDFGKPGTASAERILKVLLASGLWVLLRQRPFNVIPDPAAQPRDMFISCFDTAPLAPDYSILMEGKEEAFLAGIEALRKLTRGDVHLGTAPNSISLFRSANGAKVHTFSGPHPAGSVGVQIHHIAPIAKGEVVWTVKPQDVAIIGRAVSEGVFDARRTVALTGAEVRTTGYADTYIGASIRPFVQDNLAHAQDRVRFISGNVLTGRRLEPDGHLGLFDDQITVIEEGVEPEFLGWLRASYPRPSMSRTLLSFLSPRREYRVNSNLHGEERAFVMTGEYERVVPMDLYPQHLLKAILCRDFDQMEGLGIYEVVEEDLALCEFICTSKQPVQRILREGLDWIRAEM